jgi:putative PIN family toxin of toxin-antitoxin system
VDISRLHNNVLPVRGVAHKKYVFVCSISDKLFIVFSISLARFVVRVSNFGRNLNRSLFILDNGIGITNNTDMGILSIVIDTNVIVSGLRSNRGASFKILQLIGTGSFVSNLSVPLLLEYEDVLHRQLSQFLHLTTQDIDDILDFFCAHCVEHEIFYLWRPSLPDPGDEMILELAVKAQCEYIVTHNIRDFRGAEQFGVAIVTPVEFLRIIGEI